MSRIEHTEKLEEGLYKILTKANCPPQFYQWCNKAGIQSPTDIAIRCISEDKIDEKIIERCKWTGYDENCDLHETAIRKAWLLCRDIHKSGDKLPEERAAKMAPLTSLEALWTNRHHTSLSTTRRVGQTLMNKLRVYMTSIPPMFEIIALERITLLCSVHKNTEESVQKAEDGTLVAKDVDLELVTGLRSIFKKITALFHSFAFVLIDDPTKFSLQDAEHFIAWIEEEVEENDWMPDPVFFYTRAYLKTMRIFQTAIMQNNQTLADIVKEKSSWIYLWRCAPGVYKDTKQTGSVPFLSKTQMKKQFAFMNRQNPGNRQGGKQSNGKKGGGKKPWNPPPSQWSQQGFQVKKFQGKGGGGTYQKPWNDNKGNKGQGKGGKGQGKGGKNNGGKGKNWWK